MPQLPGVQAEISENSSRTNGTLWFMSESLCRSTQLLNPDFEMKVFQSWNISGGGQGVLSSSSFMCSTLLSDERQGGFCARLLWLYHHLWLQMQEDECHGRSLQTDIFHLLWTLCHLDCRRPSGSLASLFRQASVISQGYGSCTFCNNLAKLHWVSRLTKNIHTG